MPTANSTLTTETLAEQYFAAWEARDPERIVEMHAQDTRFQIHAGGEVAEGREAVRVAVRSAEAPEELLAQADLVVDGPPGLRELLERLAAPAGSS